TCGNRRSAASGGRRFAQAHDDIGWTANDGFVFVRQLVAGLAFLQRLASLAEDDRNFRTAFAAPFEPLPLLLECEEPRRHPTFTAGVVGDRYSAVAGDHGHSPGGRGCLRQVPCRRYASCIRVRLAVQDPGGVNQDEEEKDRHEAKSIERILSPLNPAL